MPRSSPFGAMTDPLKALRDPAGFKTKPRPNQGPAGFPTINPPDTPWGNPGGPAGPGSPSWTRSQSSYSSCFRPSC